MSPPSLPRRPETAAIVSLPTWESYSYLQTVVGKPSPVSSDLEEFRGIPYGTITARWEHSQLRTRLPQDIFDATKNGPKCPQPSAPNDSRTFQSYLAFPDDVAESEFDCLNLFVVRPSREGLQKHGIEAATPRLPVLVWIHGGACAFGAATDPMWDPSRIALRALQRGSPIVTVSINYRLNFFGFGGSTDILRSQDLTGVLGLNFGLRDQKVALEWVARNIAAFGGDPDRVTIGGQSAGSFSVHCHLTEAEGSLEKSLFRRAIMQSGAIGTLGPVTLDTADETWESLCKYWGVDTEESERDRVDLLKRLPAAKLVESARDLRVDGFPAIFDNITFFPGTPAEGNIGIDLGPVALQKRPGQSPQPRIDVLLGVTDCECCIFIPPSLSWEKIQSAFDGAYSDPTRRAEVMKAYTLDKSASNEDLQKSMVTFFNDTLFEVPVHLARETLAKRRRTSGNLGGDGVHSYHIEFGNPFRGPSQGVAHHCVELIYLFEAFHDALLMADQGVVGQYEEPAAGVNVKGAAVPGNAGSNSGIDLSSESDNQAQETLKNTSYKCTNIELCHALQDHWLDFIVLDEYAPAGKSHEIAVYGQDRTMRNESLVDTADWNRRSERWKLAAQDLEALGRVRNGI